MGDRDVGFGEVEIRPTEDAFSGVRKTVETWEENSTLLLFDARHAAYRAIHTREGLTSPGGEDTRGLHGFLEIVAGCCSAFRTSRYLAVWDGGVEFKRIVHPQYKSRHDAPRSPEEVAEVERNRAAMRVCREGTDAIGLRSVFHEKFEADDLIGVCSSIAMESSPYARVVVVSDDKDMLQLVQRAPAGREVLVWRGVSKKLVDLDEFRRQFPFDPSRYVDYKALIGEPETGDNIPGVEGFGEKRAATYIASHGGIEAAIAYSIAAISLPKKTKLDVSLATSVDAARLSYRLSRIPRSSGDLAAWCPAGETSHAKRAYALCESEISRLARGPGVGARGARMVLQGRYGFSADTCDSVLGPLGYR